jgi:hydroxymethylglutaryl-CoA reductase
MIDGTLRSSVQKFYEMNYRERLEYVRKFARLTDAEVKILKNCGGLSLREANRMVENAIGTMAFPLGIATNFLINGRDYLIPMAIEEPSVIAAASKAAKIARLKGGFTATADQSLMIGQVHVVELDDPIKAGENVLKRKDEIIRIANSKSKTLSKKGAGAKDVTFRIIDTGHGQMLIVELIVDVQDAMGANVVNTMCEAVAHIVQSATNGRVLLRILSNYAVRRLARAKAVFSKEEIGSKVVDDIVLAYAFANSDQSRCTTHNKGVMNGIVAVGNATGQDSRAIEAGAHSYASRSGRYSPITSWSKNSEGDLVGNIELPLAVGVVGGISSVHPLAKTCIKILRVKSAQELACVMASAGLAQNFAALRALVSEGIQKGHMNLHARNIAVMAGAQGSLIDLVARKISEEGNVTTRRAKEVMKMLEGR